MSEELHLTPWEIEALELPNHWGLTQHQRCDYVIERWLMVGGDTRPFFDWVLRAGHQPSRRVVEIVAQMMAKSAGIDLPAEMVPTFGLVVDRAGHANGPKDMVAEVRDYCLGAISDAKIDNGIRPKRADEKTMKFANQCGLVGVNFYTVEKARKAFRKSRGKYLRKPRATKGKE